MGAAPTLAEFGVSLLAIGYGLPEVAKEVAVSAATLAASLATMRRDKPSFDTHVNAALAALERANFEKTDLNIAKDWLQSRPPITLSHSKLAQHRGDLPRYLIEILSNPPLPPDSTTRMILLLCLTSAFDSVRIDDGFHAPFTQDMLIQMSADLGGVVRKQDQTLAGIADLKALLLAQAQRDQPQLYAQHTETLIALAATMPQAL